MEEIEKEWLNKIHEHCPGPAKQIIDLQIQDNAFTCVFPFVSRLLLEEAEMPLPILRTLLSIFGRKEAALYVSSMLYHQRGPKAKELSLFLNQWIVEATTPSNAHFVFSNMKLDYGYPYQVCLLGKVADCAPELIPEVHEKYSTLMKDPEVATLVPKWMRRYSNRGVRAGLKKLAAYGAG